MKNESIWASCAKELTEKNDVIITCLPSPKSVRDAMECSNGVLERLKPGSFWIEMSTTDEKEIQRLGSKVKSKGGLALEAPVSGGCHRATTGNISIFIGGERTGFDRVFPVLRAMGRKILHDGKLGSASAFKVVTNYLASTHLVALREALMVCKKSGIELSTAFERILISSGNSFVHETESQVILNDSYNINFTMDLVCKDTGLFDSLGKRLGIPLKISLKIVEIFQNGRKRYGDRAWYSMIVKRLEEACSTNLREPGFPDKLVDDTPEVPGEEIRVHR